MSDKQIEGNGRPINNAESEPGVELNNSGAFEPRNFRRRLREHLVSPTGFLEVIGALILFIGVFVNGALWLAQLRANGINQEALIAANRPWIKVTITASDLTWWPNLKKNQLGNMSPSIFIENVGHSPAIAVKADAFAYIEGSKKPFDVSQKDRCGSIANATPDPGEYGSILFPGDKIDASKQSIGQTGFGIEQSEIDKVISDKTTPETFSFLIYGCADYVFGSPQRHYQTFFSYEVWRFVKHTGPTTGSVSSTFVLGQNVAVQDILIDQTPQNNYAN